MNQRQLYEQYTDNLLDSVFQSARYAEPNLYGWQDSIPVQSKSPTLEQPRSPLVARKSVQSPTPKKLSVVRKKVPQQESNLTAVATSTSAPRKKKKRIIKKIIYEQASDTEDEGSDDNDDDDDDDDDDDSNEKVIKRANNKHKLQNISHNNHQQQQQQVDTKPLVTRKNLRNTLLRRKKLAKPKAQDILQAENNARTQEPNPKAYVDDIPSFWRPRESRKKGWWKGNKAQGNQDDNDNDGDERQGSSTTIKKDYKISSSIKAKRAARPMSFKTPKRKNKVSGSGDSTTAMQNNYMAVPTAAIMTTASSQPTTTTSGNTTAVMAPQTPVMYAMPQMFAQQPLFPQQMLSQFTQPMLFGQPSPMYYHPQTSETVNNTASEDAKNKRKTTIYNPREASHDKCSIM